MKKRSQFLACLVVSLLILYPGVSRLTIAKEGRAKATLKKRSENPERESAKAARKVAHKPQQISGTSEKISKVATINFAEMARREALAPQQELHIVPEPMEEEEETRKRPVPPNAVFFRDESGAPSTPQLLSPSPIASLSFQGSGQTNTYPPDTQGAAGPNHLLVAVNGGLLIQSKTGVNLSFNTLVNFFGSASLHQDVFDPRVQYDPYGNRWIFIADADRTSAASAILVAVSQTSDPTGNWNIYRIDSDPADQSWADFPVLGFNKDWIVVSTNMYPLQGDIPQSHSRFYVLGKANAYAGITTNLTRLYGSDSDGLTIVPASTYDPTLSTMYLMQDFNGNFNGNGYLRLYTITGAIGSEVLDNISSQLYVSTSNPWDDIPPGHNDFAPQAGAFEKIHINDADLQNVVYRNGSLWCAHSIFLPAGGPTRSSIQWWQINPTTASIQQRGRIDDVSGNVFYGFPSIAVNKNNDVLIGYSRFSASQYAGVGYAYRAGTDPLNTLRDDTTLKVGEGVYSPRPDDLGRHRWGDYSSTTVDPSNDTDMWTLQEYAASFSQWSTWWGRINGGSSLPTGPANNNFINAQVIGSNTGIISGTTVNATKESGEPNHAGNAGGASVWYQWQAPTSGSMTISTAGSSFDTLLAVYTGSNVGALTPIVSNDDVSASDGTSRVVFNVTSGATYRIAVDGYVGTMGNVTLSWNNIPLAPANNNFANAQVISGSAGGVTGTSAGATKEIGEPNHAGNGGGASVWYQWQAPTSGSLTISTTGSNFDTLLGIYTGNSVGSLTTITSNDDDPSSNSLTSRVTFNVVGGTTYRIAVDGYSGGTGSITLNWNLVASCSYSIAPQTQSFAFSGGAGSVNVTATAGCPWTATSNAPFINITSGASGTGNGTVSYSVAANTTTGARIGTMIIAGQIFTVSQAACPISPSIHFSALSYSVGEGGVSATITVTRSGNTAGATSVNYATSDGTARQSKDYTIASGTLGFSAGEVSKSFTVLITDNAYVDGNRTINLTLSNPTGGNLSAPSVAVLTILDNDTKLPTSNPIDNAQFFVTQHYYDFLNREPDAGGLAYWSSQLTQCGADATCLNSRRISVSAAYFIELEFQDTGSLVYRFYKASYGVRPTYSQFMPDRSRVVGGNDLEAGKQAFAQSWVQRPEFLARYPATLTGIQFIDAMLQTVSQGSGVNLSMQRTSLINDYNANQSRARIVRLIADDATFKAAEYNHAFVMMQYFGYLRRDPEQAGYDFWLDVLNNKVPNNYRGMVCAFITSAEYQARFSPVRTRNDSICASTP